MNIVFLGSGAFGLPTLERLARDHTISAVLTQPDRKAGRGGKMTPTPIGDWASEHLAGVPILKPERINEPEVRDQVRAFAADAWVVIAYGQYLGQKLIEGRFAINLHASRLPRWRGAAPINAAIVAGDTVTGNSVITIDKEMDAGDVLGQSDRAIEPDQTASELHDLLSKDGPDLVCSVLDAHSSGAVTRTAQAPSLVTVASKMAKSDGWVDFAASADEARSRINGLSPWPCVSVKHRDSDLKILRAQPAPFESQSDRAEPGTIIDPNLGLVACGEGAVQLLTVQPPGKRPMDWSDYANGRQVQEGETLTAHRP